MRLVAFSDWRIQDLADALNFVRNQEDPPDLFLYAGDDLGRFYEEGQNYFKEFASYTSEGKVLAVAGNDDLPECQFRVIHACILIWELNDDSSKTLPQKSDYFN